MKKTGFRNQKQRYKCHACGKQFVGGKRLDPEQIWKEYVEGKQTYKQLSEKYGCSQKTIQRKIDLCAISFSNSLPRKVVVLMDTTYWGRDFGVMLFKDAYTKENLLKYYVKAETNQMYRAGVKELQKRGFTVVAIVCDGRRGLLQSFKDIPVQMCQFHQVAIIRRYITKNPKLVASVELKEIVALLKQTDKESFQGALDEWYYKWKSFLNERTTNPETGKSYYTHKRLRSAHRSLKTNLKWLFIWYEEIELEIPNTTNAIDGHFSDLKNKLRNHNGLSIARKKKFIDEFFKV